MRAEVGEVLAQSEAAIRTAASQVPAPLCLRRRRSCRLKNACGLRQVEAADIGTARLRRGMTQLLGEEVTVRAGDGDGGAQAVVEAVLEMVGDRLRTLEVAKASLSRRLTESTLAATVGQSELAELKEAHRREKATELRAVQEAAQRAEVRSHQTQKSSPTPETPGLSAAAGVVWARRKDGRRCRCSRSCASASWRRRRMRSER